MKVVGTHLHALLASFDSSDIASNTAPDDDQILLFYISSA
jgi:hypothetical protein